MLAIGVAVLGVRWWRARRRRKSVDWDDQGEDLEVELELLGDRREEEGWSHG